MATPSTWMKLDHVWVNMVTWVAWWILVVSCYCELDTFGKGQMKGPSWLHSQNADSAKRPCCILKSNTSEYPDDGLLAGKDVPKSKSWSLEFQFQHRGSLSIWQFSSAWICWVCFQSGLKFRWKHTMYVYVHMCDVHRKSICKRCITTATELKEIELGEVCETHDDYITNHATKSYSPQRIRFWNFFSCKFACNSGCLTTDVLTPFFVWIAFNCAAFRDWLAIQRDHLEVLHFVSFESKDRSKCRWNFMMKLGVCHDKMVKLNRKLARFDTHI